MMIKNFHFTVAEHEEYGFLGAAAQWLYRAEPVQGFGAAHDILDHLDSSLGTDSELEALGTNAWRVGLDKAQKYLYSDISDMLINQDEWGRVYPCGASPNCALYDSAAISKLTYTMRAACHRAYNYALSEFEVVLDPADMQNIIQRLVNGYCNAAAFYNKRFGLPAFKVQEIRDSIVRQFDEKMKHASERDVIVVSVDYWNAHVETSRLTWEDEGHPDHGDYLNAIAEDEDSDDE